MHSRPLQSFLIIMIFTLFMTVESENLENRLTSRLIERLLEKKLGVHPSSNKFHCLPCLLRLYLENVVLHGAKHNTPTNTKRLINEIFLWNILGGKETSSMDKPYSPHKDHHSASLRSSQGGVFDNADDEFALASRENDATKTWRRNVEEEDNYLDFDDNTFSDIDDDIYYEDLPNELKGLYSARFNLDSYDIEKMDYQDHMANPHMEMCKTRKSWRLLNETRNQRGEKVRVLPRTHEGLLQFVYAYECLTSECERCNGIRRNSRCRMRESYLNLYHEVNGVKKYGYVVVPTHCTCELLPKGYYPEGCPNKSKRNHVGRK